MNSQQSLLRWLLLIVLSVPWVTTGSSNALAERSDFGRSSFAGKTTPTSLWSKAEFNGTRVYQRNDLIDAALVDARGRTNLERMQGGLASIGPDGKPLNLHYTIQSADGPLAEMTATFHQQKSRVIHINPNTIPSGIADGLLMPSVVTIG